MRQAPAQSILIRDLGRYTGIYTGFHRRCGSKPQGVMSCGNTTHKYGSVNPICIGANIGNNRYHWVER